MNVLAKSVRLAEARRRVRYSVLCILAFAASSLSALESWAVTPWFPFGPDGGDARAFASDPHNREHLFLGAANGWIYDSENGGHTWKRLARVGNRDDLVLDNIVVDPSDSKHILAGTWVLGGADGGLFVSNDGGTTWTSNPEMAHQSVRALTAAPSDGRIVVAGTLQGVYRSVDGGVHWGLISPPGSTEIHEVESIAIDPTDPRTIYAGTWHLPWKTTNGGATWNNIKQGIIEDSDVFSIIVDPKQPETVYASACSGIYKSEDGGGKFTKIQGIPATARRTRVLMQDPQHLGTVYAGTTEGLFRTDDAGVLWTRTTSEDVIVNDVYVDPANSMHVLMATDRGGVLASSDGGVSFVESNTGFSSRQIVAFASDPRRPAEVYVGVVNDKQWGGVFFSNDGGLAWSMRSNGLDGRDVFSLAIAEEGAVVAGTEHGIFLYDPASQFWKRAGDIQSPGERYHPKTRSGAVPATGRSRASVPLARIEGAVPTLVRVDGQMYAVTTDGLFATVTEDPAALWTKVEGPTEEPWRFLAGGHATMLLASLKSLSLSLDNGRKWRMIGSPPALSQIGAVAVDGAGGLWVGGREGIFRSIDNGATWTTSKNLYVNGVNNIFYDASGSRLLITASGSSTFAFSLHLPDQTMKFWDTGWNLRFMRPVGDYLLGITRYDGVVVQPRMVQSAENPKPNYGVQTKELASQ